jgi:hypothetical protein
MRCSRYRPISVGANGQAAYLSRGVRALGVSQRDLPCRHHTRSWRGQDETPGPLASEPAQLATNPGRLIQKLQRVKRRDLSCETARRCEALRLRCECNAQRDRRRAAQLRGFTPHASAASAAGPLRC